MPSKQVTNRQKSATSVIAAGETHASRIGTELASLLTPFLRNGEVCPNLVLLTHLASRALEESRDTMVTADEAHVTELSDDTAPRNARDEAAAALYGELTDQREWLTGLFGASAMRQLGFTDATPRDPVLLHRYAGEVVTALKSPSLPAPKRPGVTWDPAETVQRLETLRASLQGHLRDVAREARKAEATMLIRNKAMDAYDERFTRVASFLTGLFRLAGYPDLAERVRPSARRPGQTEEDAPPAPAGKGGSGGEEESGE